MHTDIEATCIHTYRLHAYTYRLHAYTHTATCIHIQATCIHTYRATCMHTYRLHAYTHTGLHAYRHTGYMHTHIEATCIHTYRLCTYRAILYTTYVVYRHRHRCGWFTLHLPASECNVWRRNTLISHQCTCDLTRCDWSLALSGVTSRATLVLADIARHDTVPHVMHALLGVAWANSYGIIWTLT